MLLSCHFQLFWAIRNHMSVSSNIKACKRLERLTCCSLILSGPGEVRTLCTVVTRIMFPPRIFTLVASLVSKPAWCRRRVLTRRGIGPFGLFRKRHFVTQQELIRQPCCILQCFRFLLIDECSDTTVNAPLKLLLKL